MSWAEAHVVLQQLDDGAVEALACIYVGRLAGKDPDDVILGDYEHGVVLVAQAEVAVFAAERLLPALIFSGPPLSIEVIPVHWR